MGRWTSDSLSGMAKKGASSLGKAIGSMGKKPRTVKASGFYDGKQMLKSKPKGMKSGSYDDQATDRYGRRLVD